MDYSNLFHKNLISLNVDYSSQAEMFEKVSFDLEQEGFVEHSFKEALIEREKEFPTGLSTNEFNVAIPHTDVKHVKYPFIYVTTSIAPLDFVQMGSDSSLIKVNTIFILGIKDPQGQVGLLSEIMEKIQNVDFIKTFKKCSSN